MNLSTPLGLLVGAGRARPVPARAGRPACSRPASACRCGHRPSPSATSVLLRLDDAGRSAGDRRCSCTRRGTPRSTPAASGRLMLPLYVLASRVVVAAVRRPVVVQRLRGARGTRRRRLRSTGDDGAAGPRSCLRRPSRAGRCGSWPPAPRPCSSRPTADPLSFTERDDGTLEASRGGGGLVSGLSGLEPATSVVWVCAALSDGDRAAARQAPGGRLDRAGHDTGGTAVRMLDIDPATFHRAYNAVANSTLWFVHHLLYAIADVAGLRRRVPARVGVVRGLQRGLRRGAGRGGRARARKVLVQDYHLTLAAAACCASCGPTCASRTSRTRRGRRPTTSGCCPTTSRARRCSGMLGADHAGFHSPRWAQAFADCCVERARRDRGPTATARSTSRRAHHRGSACTRSASTPTACASGRAEDDVESRLRGAARAGSATGRPSCASTAPSCRRTSCAACSPTASCCGATREWRGQGRAPRVRLPEPARPAGVPRVHRARCSGSPPRSRTSSAPTTGGRSILDVNDDYARSLAALPAGRRAAGQPDPRRHEPRRQGGPGALRATAARWCCRAEAGAADELGDDALLVNPFDVSGTADALHAALSMPADERRRAAPSGWPRPRPRCRRSSGSPTRSPRSTDGGLSARPGQPWMPAGPGSV